MTRGNNRPGLPFSHNLGRINPGLNPVIQQQQIMQQQHQQFLARQQIEQLKQNQLNAAIRDLQMKTIQQNQQSSAMSPQQQPSTGQLLMQRPPVQLPKGFVGPLNRMPIPNMGLAGQPNQLRAPDLQHAPRLPNSNVINRNNSGSQSTLIELNRSSSSTSFFQSANNYQPLKPQLSSNVTDMSKFGLAGPGLMNSNPTIGQPPGFGGNSNMPPRYENSVKSVHTPNQLLPPFFRHLSGSTGVSDQQPPLLNKNSIITPPQQIHCVSSNTNVPSRQINLPDSTRHADIQSVGKGEDQMEFTRDSRRDLSRRSGSSVHRNAQREREASSVRDSSDRNNRSVRGDSQSARPKQSNEREKRSVSKYSEKGRSRLERGNTDRSQGMRSLERSSSERWRSDRHSKDRSGSRDRYSERSNNRSCADKQFARKTDGLNYIVDRRPSVSGSRSSESIRYHSQSRERSVSSTREHRRSHSRNESSATRDHPGNRVRSDKGTQSPVIHGNSSKERAMKRSCSPSLSSEQDFSVISSQLSQYRKDLLRSEQRKRESENISAKKRKIDNQVDGASLETGKDDDQGDDELESMTYYIRSCPADLYFIKNSHTGNMEATTKMVDLENRFEEEIVKRAEKVRATQEHVEEPPIHPPVQHSHHHHHHHHCSGNKSSSCESSSDEDEDDEDDDEGNCSQIMEEWDRRKKHPYSLHPELWFNIRGQANDGPLCRCSIKSRQSGIRHEIYPGEIPIPMCELETSNLNRLYHYRVTMSPYTNFLTKVPTLINHDNHEYIFEGFSMFSHAKLENIPPCKLLRFNIEYTIHFIPETAPENFTVRSLNLFNKFIFTEILELIDMDMAGQGDSCNRFHFMPRFCRTLPDSGCKEVLSMNTVLSFLLKSAKPLVEESRLEEIMTCGESEWHAKVDHLRGMIVTNPGMRPSSLRIDQLDRKVTTPVVKPETFCDSSENEEEREKKGEAVEKEEEMKKIETEEDSSPTYPLIIHQGYRPAQLSYAGDPVYRKAWKQYVKFRHLLNSKPKILSADKLKLKEQEEKLREIRMKKTMKREVTVELSSKGFLCTGLRADLCQHALMMPVLMSHLRFHICLDVLEETLKYKFRDRNLLQLSLTHTSYRTNYGTNPDHTRNSLTNCGMRQVEYGDRRIHYQNTRKRGICILVDIMSRLGKQEETISEIPHNERLEFLGDAVIEFLTSVHLFYMFPWLEEGGLTTYRMALVQNQHLAVLAKKLKLQDFMLYVHGPDLCHESDLRHAMANCCEAIMGALFLDGGLDEVDEIFSRTLFDDDDVLLHTWKDLPKHVLQQEEPGGDRHWVKSSPILQKLEKFEEMIGIKFSHIRLLAKAFTHRNIGVNPLTMGHNQRLEFLGDTVLQLVASEYLYKHYPEHHEGHLSLLRSSLVNSRTQGLVYDDLGMSEFVICNENAINEGLDMKTKQRADILESFVGALYVDKDLDYCRSFCNVCFFPRLKDFIMNQDWNDPKSQLQQCCLTLREVGGGEPDIPVYKVIKSIGPTNTRKYVVAVYFRGKRLAQGTGHSIQQAEMAAATQALKKRSELFPILQHQRRFLERMKKGDMDMNEGNHEPSLPSSPSSSSSKKFKRSSTRSRMHNLSRRKAN